MRPIALLLILILSSCAVTREKLVGRYGYCPAFEICADLQLHKDSTFVYNSGIGELVLAEGYWTIQKKELLLMSSSEPLISFEKVNTHGTTLHVKADPDMPLPGAIINFYKNAQLTKVTSDIRGAHLRRCRTPTVSWFRTWDISGL